MTRQIKEGPGWRIGWDDDSNQVFQGLLGGEHWSIELTNQEYQDFCRVAQQLAATLQSMDEELMAEERIACEQETETLWMEAEGYPNRFSLRFILLTGRRGEGGWSAAIVPDLLAAITNLNAF